MDFYIYIIEHGLNYELIFSVMRDFRLGGLNSDNYEKLIKRAKKFPDIVERYFNSSKEILDFTAIADSTAIQQMKVNLMRHNLSDLQLKDISESEAKRIWKRVVKILVERTKLCWHPEASYDNCTKDNEGRIKISSAHSIQKNKILKGILENHQVKSFKLNSTEDDMAFPIKFASTFFGFCDKHDKIFDPIEKQNYSGTSEQNFLFAYRAFVHSSHIKLVFNEFLDSGLQAKSDIIAEKKIMEDIILHKNYRKMITDLLILDYAYPIVVSSSSDLDYDYNGHSILHSDARMERFYLSVFPQNNKTYILFSYLDDDSKLYGEIVHQIKTRKKIESDISVLISGHCENTFFKPSYYHQHIEKQEENINKLLGLTQFDFVPIDGYGRKSKPISLTPKDYLDNSFNIQIFFK
jgi:hypothetical protein